MSNLRLVIFGVVAVAALGCAPSSIGNSLQAETQHYEQTFATIGRNLAATADGLALSAQVTRDRANATKAQREVDSYVYDPDRGCETVETAATTQATTLSVGFEDCDVRAGQWQTRLRPGVTTTTYAMVFADYRDREGVVLNGATVWQLTRYGRRVTIAETNRITAATPAPVVAAGGLQFEIDLDLRTVAMAGTAQLVVDGTPFTVLIDGLQFDPQSCPEGPAAGSLVIIDQAGNEAARLSVETCNGIELLVDAAATGLKTEQIRTLFAGVMQRLDALFVAFAAAEPELVEMDTVPPDTLLLKSIASPTNITRPTFEFAGTDAVRFECSLDAAAWSTCVSPLTVVNTVEGKNELRIRAIDAAGNIDPTPAMLTWIQDTFAPVVTISGGLAAMVLSRDLITAFNSDGAVSFECSLDGGPFSPCFNNGAYTDLNVGRHTLDVRGTDAAGNLGPVASYNWLAGIVAAWGNRLWSPPMIEDLDGDGDDEFIATDLTETVLARGIFDNDVDWQAQPGLNGVFWRYPVLGDFDADTKPDVASGAAVIFGAVSTITWHGADGNELWRNTTDNIHGAGDYPMSTGDLDGDGWDELFAERGFISGWGVLSGKDGANLGGSSLIVDYALFGDFDADDDWEVVGGMGDSNNRFIRAYDTLMTLEHSVVIPASGGHTGLDNDSRFLAAANFNGTPQLEVVAFMDKRVSAVVVDTGEIIWENDAPALHPRYPALADLNGDGTADVIQHWEWSATQPSTAGVLAVFNGSNGAMMWSQPTIGNVVSPVAADIDNDGDIDVVYVEVDPNTATMDIVALEGSSGGDLDRIPVQHNLITLINGSIPQVYGPQGAFPVLRDVNRDGYLDVAVQTALGNGESFYVVHTGWPVPTDPEGMPWPRLLQNNGHNAVYPY